MEMETELIKGPTLGIRHLQAFLLFSGISSLYCSRVNIGVSVVAMTNANTTNTDFPEYDWSEKQISFVISSFYWGYVVTQFPGGMLCKRFGTKVVMGVATFSSALLSALTPWSVNWHGWQVFCAIRFLQGLFQGVTFPCIYAHLAKWSPLHERNRLGAFSLSGIEFGSILAMSISGAIAEGSMGWPGISYVSAGICLTWCVLWFIFASNNPCESKFITETEKHYIEFSMAHADKYHEKKIPVPWKAILTSLPFYAVVIARCSQIWGLSTLQAQIPSYLNGVLNMKIKANGLFSAMPFLAMWMMSYVYMLLADVLRRKNVLTLTSLRRVFNSFAFWLPAICLIGIGFLNEDYKTLALVLMTISVALDSGNIIGSALNIIDLSPNHAGTLMSIINTAANCTPFISPLVVGVIVTDVAKRTQWQIVFAIAAAVFFFGNLLYITLGSTDAQPWNAEDFLLPKNVERSSPGYENNNISDSDTNEKTKDSEDNEQINSVRL